MIDQQKKARLTLHWRVHLSIEVEFDSEHFQFWCGKLGISTEEEFLSEPSIGLFSSSKSKFRDLDQEIWLGETLGKSNPSLTPIWKKTLNTKTNTFWYILYILRLVKAQELKIAEDEDKILTYTVSKIQPHIRYIQRDMIPPS